MLCAHHPGIEADMRTLLWVLFAILIGWIMQGWLSHLLLKREKELSRTARTEWPEATFEERDKAIDEIKKRRADEREASKPAARK
jgi:hypothetical protein